MPGTKFFLRSSFHTRHTVVGAEAAHVSRNLDDPKPYTMKNTENKQTKRKKKQRKHITIHEMKTQMPRPPGKTHTCGYMWN